MASTVKTVIVIGALAIAAGAAWFAFERRAPTPADDAQARAPATAREDAGHGDDHRDHAEHGHAGHDHGDEAPSVDLRPQYFDSPQLLDARTFVDAKTPLLIEASCRANPLMAKSGTAEERLRGLYAMNPQERFPQDLFYRSMIQFWRHDGQYFQLSAIWDIGIPPVYQLRLHRSPTPRFDGQVTLEPLPDGDPGVLDAASAAEAMAAISQRYVDKGATLGLQIVETEWPAADGKGRIRTTLANGRPMSWSFPGGACSYESAASAMRCRCPSGSEYEEKPKTS